MIHATDDFNRADLGANWLVLQGACTIWDEAMFAGNTGGANTAVWALDTWLADQYVQALVKGTRPEVESVSLVLNGHMEGTRPPRLYGMFWETDANTYQRIVAVRGLSIHEEWRSEDPSILPVAGDTVRFSVKGNAYTLARNGHQYAVVIGPVLNAGRPGLDVTGDGVSSAGAWDDFLAGDYSLAPPVYDTYPGTFTLRRATGAQRHDMERTPSVQLALGPRVSTQQVLARRAASSCTLTRTLEGDGEL